MSPAHEHFQAGRLAQAVETVTAEVRSHPTDVDRRGLLAELLCFAGELDRADRQLDLIADQDPAAALGTALFRQLIRGAQARAQVFAEGRVPEFLGPPPQHLRLLLDAGIALRDGETEAAGRLTAEAETLRPQCAGCLDDAEIDDLRDIDDLVAPVVEVLTSTGKYYWIPRERVASIDFHAPVRPRDLLWRRATMAVADGPDGEVYVPTIYPTTATAGDELAKLGRVTDWQGGGDAPALGIGQHCWLAGDAAVPILQVHRFEARPAA
ncbi:type VI secretion system accessory protein TagJ [Inquilinus sp. NPDC058860]|uniref:type VI secretion system accessory protein TagJ n=1 Tax=Inquilinus sp. NPDC058860 TaxID=3346652 RepID=UPI0036AAEC7E